MSRARRAPPASTPRSPTPSASAAQTRCSSSGAPTSSAMSASLLERRLHFVVGKGGVGKTTVAAALALTLSRRGRRTLAVEMEPGGRLAALLGREADPRLYVRSEEHTSELESRGHLVCR